jgi:heme exporter protein A
LITSGPTALEGLAVEGLVKDFGAVRAVDDVSFDLEPGRSLALFGPNGAGKTTLLRILAGLTRPDRGTVRFGEGSRDGSDRAWRGRVGVLSHRTFLYDHLSAAENLEFHADLQGLDDSEDRVAAALAQVGLSGRAHARAETFSRGMRQRLSLARTLLHEPELVLLDEPFSGLDVHGGTVLADVLGALRDGNRSVVLVTHDLARGLELADRWLILVDGRVARTGNTESTDPAGFDLLYRDTVEATA